MTRLYWGGHILQHSPGLLTLGLSAGLGARLDPETGRTKICICTYHKVLTVFLSRVFRSFAAITGRGYSLGMGPEVDYDRSVLIDHHSKFDWDRLRQPFVGLHVIRDPRDLVVSSAFYHVKSREAWLHDPYPVFGGRTYQEAIRALPDTEARLIFEIDNAAGQRIRDMLDWTPRPEIAEARYHQLIGDDGQAFFAALVSQWPLSERERRLLVKLFAYFSLGGPGAKGNTHIRNAASGQWRKHFTPAVTAHFRERFPDALDRLGYPADW